MGFFEKLQSSVLWRTRLLVWGDRLRVGSKFVNRDPAMISPYVAKLMALGRYEKPERDLLVHMQKNGWIRRGDRVIEGGGGLGTITMQIADIVGDDAVFAFEPNPRTSQALRANLAINGHAIKVEDAALIAEDRDRIEFTDTIDSTPGFAIARVQRSGDTAKSTTVKSITVRAESLARAMARLDPAVLVLDVEGAEADMLCSVTDWGRVRALHVELHPDSMPRERLEAMFKHMRDAGFEQKPTSDFGSNLALFVRQGS